MTSDPLNNIQEIGPYTLLRQLGEGAMGAVYLARHEVLRVEHAIKILSPDVAHDPTARERFLREARHSARLDHPHIVRVLNADLHNNQPYLVMEYIKGRTVTSLLSAGPLATHRAVRYAYQVSLALSDAHAHGIIHRDVKPDNVMVTEDDIAKLMDFGLVLAKNNAEAGLTAVGISMGTPYFMSPEQWFDEGVDDRADIYALGVTLYHMLSKRYPFEGQDPLEVAQRMMKHELLHLQVARPDIDPAIATIVHRAMARTPAQRFQQASDLADALARWWQQHPPQIPNLTLDQPMPTAASSMITRQPSRTRLHSLGAASADNVQTFASASLSPSGSPAPASSFSGPRPPSGLSPAPRAAHRAPTGVSLNRPTPSDGQHTPRLQPMPAPGGSTPAPIPAVGSTPAPIPAVGSTPAPIPAVGSTPAPTQASIEIALNTFWIGYRAAYAEPSPNTFLRTFESPAPDHKRAHLLINPCASADMASLRAQLSPLSGDLDKLSLVFISHPDPNVSATTAALSPSLNEHAPLLASEATADALSDLGIPRARFVSTDKYDDKGLLLPTGHTLLPLPAPFCPTFGAVMLYDPDTRVLFSGDLFSSLKQPAHTASIWADASDWASVRAFHQRAMPSAEALRRAIQTVRDLSPKPQVIAPLRGRLLRGDVVLAFLDLLSHLDVGLAALDARADDPHTLSAWNTVFQRVARVASRVLGPLALDPLNTDPILRDDLQQDPTATCGLRITRLGPQSVSRALQVLSRGADPHAARLLQYEAISACDELHLPTAKLDLPQLTL
jgi:serine/threonine protein kinase/glyoxylase-like metal-dependent hydrolase (beta-lactamase superfamily II)